MKQISTLECIENFISCISFDQNKSVTKKLVSDDNAKSFFSKYYKEYGYEYITKQNTDVIAATIK